MTFATVPPATLVSCVLRALCVAVMCVQAAPLAAQGSGNPTDMCQIVTVTGPDSSLVRGETRVPAATGQVLVRDDVVQTGAESRLTLRCSSDLEVVVGPDTTLRLDRLVDIEDDASWGVQLLNGIAGFVLGNGGRSDFQVHTPSAVAAVRSTEWAMTVEDRATATFVRDGRVVVAAADGAVTLTPGDGVDVAVPSIIGEVKQWGAGRIAEFDARLGPDWTQQ